MPGTGILSVTLVLNNYIGAKMAGHAKSGLSAECSNLPLRGGPIELEQMGSASRHYVPKSLVEEGASVVLDDDLVMHFTKQLRAG